MSIISNLHGRTAYMNHIDGNRLSDEGKVEAADAKYQKALANYATCVSGGNPKPAYLMAYSVLLMRYRRFGEAKDMLRKADKMPISKDEKRKLRINFAICEWKEGRLDEAIELMRSVYLDLKNSIVYGSLGYMLIEKAVKTGDFTEALAFNQEAYEYDEDDAVVLDNMGQMYLRMGEKEKALGYFENAHQIKPKQVDTLYYLALLYSESGKTEEAKELLDTALRGNFSALCTTTREMAQELRRSLGE